MLNRHLKPKFPKWNLWFSLELLLPCSTTHKASLYLLRSSWLLGFSHISHQCIGQFHWYSLKSALNASNMLEHFLNLFLITLQLSSSLSYQYRSFSSPTWSHCLLLCFPEEATTLILLRHSPLLTTLQWLLSHGIKSKVLTMLTRPCDPAPATSLTSSPTLFSWPLLPTYTSFLAVPWSCPEHSCFRICAFAIPLLEIKSLLSDSCWASSISVGNSQIFLNQRGIFWPVIPYIISLLYVAFCLLSVSLMWCRSCA